MKKILSAVLACVLLLGCVFALASCGAAKPNANAADAKAALEAAGYEVEMYDTAEYLAHFGVEGLAAFVSAYIEEDDEIKEAVNIYYLTDGADADKAYEAIEAIFNEGKEDVPELELVIGKADKMVWFGTKAAVEAAK